MENSRMENSRTRDVDPVVDMLTPNAWPEVPEMRSITRFQSRDNIVRITPKWYNISVMRWEGGRNGAEKPY